MCVKPKKQRAAIQQGPSHLNESVAALKTHPQKKVFTPQALCPGCGAQPHPAGRTQCPAYRTSCHNCKKLGHFARVCRSRPVQPNENKPPRPCTTTLQSDIPLSQDAGLSNIHHVTSTNPAPKLQMDIITLNGAVTTAVLPDSGADISAAGTGILSQLNEHIDNLLPSSVIPKAANGAKMHPVGRLPVCFKIGNKKHLDDLHIYPNVTGTLMSWNTCKELGILPDCYPNPTIMSITVSSIANTTAIPPSSQSSLDKHSAVQEFPTVFDGNIDSMEGEKFHIYLTDDAKPFCVNTPRSIPYAYRDKLKAELDLLQSQNIIAPVTEATDWCAPIVVAPKKNSDRIRMCVDLSHLNRYVKRERYQSPTPAEAIADISACQAKFFTVLDAMKGYHQCPLDQESQLLTTFITPFGRFKYMRAPYGISSISEHYDRHMYEAFQGLSGFRQIVDDIVIYDSDATQHATHVREFLHRCVEKKVTLNLDKCKFCESSVTFAGFKLSATGYQVDRTITDAISKFPTPANRTDLRSFFGLVNQLSASTNTISTLLTPLRPLLSTKNDFQWSDTHDQAFHTVKASLTVAPMLSFFDMNKPTRLCTDASRHGLGFVLQQRDTSGTWTLVQAGSRFLTDAESRYAIIELEMLAVAWATLKCHLFLAGLQHFQVVTDHNPLVPILNHHRLDEIENPRLQRLKIKLMAYNFTTEWVKGTKNGAPDALSRNPVTDPSLEDTLAELDILSQPDLTITEIRTLTSTEPLPYRLENLRECAQEDTEYQQLQQYILHGFPQHRNHLPDACKRYWNTREGLTIDDGLIVYGCRLLIPTKLRPTILSQLHESHQGSVRTKQRARLSVYWPGIDNDIDNIILSCQHCQDHLPSHAREPIVQKPRPERPFQEIAIDLCSHAGQTYLIIVDCYTDWPAVITLRPNTTTYTVISALRQSFCHTAIPDTIWSDGGPQFTSKAFSNFSTRWGFLHKFSSPRYPQSNGKVEATVKSMKKLIQHAWNGRALEDEKFCRSLLQYRNTPSRKDGLPPAQKLFGHPVQDILPAHRRSFLPQWQRPVQEATQQAEDTSKSSAAYYNLHAHNLPDIHVGSHVAVQNPQSRLWDIYGIVTEIGPHRRYIKTTGEGS